MTIINLMLGKKRGGLEQAAIDYAQALAACNIPAFSILPPDSWVGAELTKLQLPWQPLTQHSGLDIFAAWKLKRMLKKAGADAVVCHGNRALSLALLSRSKTKKIAVAHNYKTRRFSRADGAFAITVAARDSLVGNGMRAEVIHHLPNMVRVRDLPTRPAFRNPPVIGSMGRFIAKKGFDLFLDALAILQSEGVAFQASLGGGGEEYDRLRQRVLLNKLESRVTMPGWIEDKAAWFAGIDIFVLPSHHEPFGIVLIEAMAEAVPVIAAASVGPQEIIRDGTDGLLCPVGDAKALAARLRELLENPAKARSLGAAGHARVAAEYSLASMTARLNAALAAILTGN